MLCSCRRVEPVSFWLVSQIKSFRYRVGMSEIERKKETSTYWRALVKRSFTCALKIYELNMYLQLFYNIDINVLLGAVHKPCESIWYPVRPFRPRVMPNSKLDSRLAEASRGCSETRDSPREWSKFQLTSKCQSRKMPRKILIFDIFRYLHKYNIFHVFLDIGHL